MPGSLNIGTCLYIALYAHHDYLHLLHYVNTFHAALRQSRGAALGSGSSGKGVTPFHTISKHITITANAGKPFIEEVALNAI
jgi:hypothetical protein